MTRTYSVAPNEDKENKINLLVAVWGCDSEPTCTQPAQWNQFNNMEYKQFECHGGDLCFVFIVCSISLSQFTASLVPLYTPNHLPPEQRSHHVRCPLWFWFHDSDSGMSVEDLSLPHVCSVYNHVMPSRWDWTQPGLTQSTPKPLLWLTHLSAPVAVSLTATLLSSSMGPKRLTASLCRKPGMVWLCCTTREMLAHANSRTSALGLCNYRNTAECKPPPMMHLNLIFTDSIWNLQNNTHAFIFL